MTSLYGYPDMGRFGLGHSLMAWGRCVIWCEKTGAEMLAPHWLRLRIGPYLRGERDKREYVKLFNNKGMIRGPLRDWHLRRSKKIYGPKGNFEQDIYDPAFLDSCRQGSRPTALVFENPSAQPAESFFHEVYGHHAQLHARMRAMVRPRYLPTHVDREAIAIHVRMGDFFVPKDEADLTQSSARLPVDWYGEVLDKIRAALGHDRPAVVYSDGTDEELALLLARPAVTRPPKQESVTDLLSIAEAPLLIASGSGFSLWGGFFGQVPTIHFPGRKRVTALDDPALEIELGDGQALPDQFVAHERIARLGA